MRPERLFGWLLRLLPFDFRADYGGEMAQVFGDEHREAERRGRVGLARLWWGTVLDILRTGPREHLAQLRQDGCYALRSMGKHRAFTLGVVVTLALGIGANTAVFSLVWAVLLKPLPYREPDRLVALWNRWDGLANARLSNPEFLDYVERTRSLDIAAEAPGAVTLGDGEPEQLPGSVVTANMLDVLGAAPALGRAFVAEEEREGVGNVVLLSDALWRRRFGADRGVVGRAISVNGTPSAIVGVLPAGFRLASDFRSSQPAQVLVPLTLDRAAPRLKRGGHYLLAVARPRNGTGIPAARAEIDTVVAGLIREYPGEHDQGHFGVSLVSLRTDLLGPARPVLLVLSCAVGLVLLLTCANVAGLLLARSEGRRQELAVRAALGAALFRLVRQLMTEALALSLAGTTLGLAVAAAILRLVRSLAPDTLPRLDEASLDLPVFGFAIGISLAVALAFGALPALQISRAGVSQVLGETARGSTSGRTWMRRSLVAAQVAIAMVLLASAGLLLKSFVRLRNVASGLNPANVLTARIAAPESRYPRSQEVTEFFARLLTDLRTLPGVRSAGASSGLPLGVGSGDWSFDVEGRPKLGKKHSGAADWYAVSPGYFESLSVRLVRGRFPAESDTASATPVIFLNEAAARDYFHGRDPLGVRVRLTQTTGPEQPWRQVAGIVGDVRHRGLDQPTRPEMYLPHAQFLHFAAGVEARDMSLVVRSAAASPSLARAIREALRQVDPEIPLADVRAMDAVIAGSVADRWRDLGLMGAFALLALTLACVGVYGLIATDVAQRRRDTGVRMVLGAARHQVVRLVLGQALLLVQAGVIAGFVAAVFASGLLRDMLFEVQPRDLGVLVSVALLLVAIGAAASLPPALRAARMDPAAALRED